MKKITSATERKLMDVIEKTATFVNEGLSPNDAIIKAAGDLRPGDVSLVVHAYNTGRTTRQRTEGDDPFEKSAEFELADTSTILEALWPATVKTAAALFQDKTVSTEYSFSPVPMLERKVGWEKRARNVNWRQMGGQEILPAEPLPTDPQWRAKVAMANIDRGKRAVDESRRKAASAFDQLGRTFDELTTYFRRPDSKPMPVVKEAVIMLHGDKGEQIMDELVRVTPALTKLANHVNGRSLLGAAGREKRASVDSLDCAAEPFPLIARVVREIREYREKKATWLEVVDTFDKEAASTLLPFASPAVSPSILGLSSDVREKRSFGIDPLKALGTYSLMQNTMGTAADKIKGPTDEAEVQKTLDSLNDPAHESKLREINAQAMMQDLMINDPVISGYDPEEVMGAYNDIVQMSPSAGTQRMLMQSLLRKQLQQGQLDTFEQDQLLGFEDKLRKQQHPTTTGAGDASVV